MNSSNLMPLAAVTALSNPLWIEVFNPYLQFGVSILGGVLIVFMILNMRTKWKLNRKKLDE